MTPLPIVVLIAGPFIGSFVAATADRLIARTSLLAARSRCAACGHALGGRDLVPLVSFALLAGRCRHCGARIPRHLPVAELAGAAIGAGSGMLLPGPLAVTGALLGWSMLLLALLDVQAFWLPRVGGWALAVLGVAAGVRDGVWAEAALGAAAGWATLALLAGAYRRWRGRDGLGEGDPPLLAAGGAWVGLGGLPLLVLVAASTGIVHALLTSGRSRHTVEIPFGAHLALATWLVWLAGAARP